LIHLLNVCYALIAEINANKKLENLTRQPLYKYVCYFICLSDKKKVQVLEMSVS